MTDTDCHVSVCAMKLSNYILAWAVVLAMFGAGAAAFSFIAATIFLGLAVILGIMCMVVRFMEIWNITSPSPTPHSTDPHA